MHRNIGIILVIALLIGATSIITFLYNEKDPVLIAEDFTTETYRLNDGGLMLVIGQSKYFNRTSGEYSLFNYSETSFTEKDGSLIISWYDKKVELQMYIKDKDKKENIIDNKKVTTEIIKEDEKKYRYSHTLDKNSWASKELPERIGYDIITTNAECKVYGNDLVCDEQRISFKELKKEQGLKLDINASRIEIYSENKTVVDLSYIDPTLTINSNTEMCGTYTNYSDIAITDSSTLSACDYTGSAGDGELKFDNLTTFTVDLGSTFNAVDKGYRGGVSDGADGEGPGGGDGSTSYGGEGGGFGAYGGDGQNHVASESVPYGTPDDVRYIGSGGGDGDNGDGGDGGGYLRINATGTVDISGTITSTGGDGSASSDSGGGGSGGGIEIIAGILTGAGSITADGGDGHTTTNDGGGGGGGRIYVTILTTDSSTITYSANGGEGNLGKDGGAGTIFIKSPSSTYGDLEVDNAGTSNGEMTPLDDNLQFDNVLIENDAQVEIDNSFNVTNHLNFSSSADLYDLELKSNTEMYLGNFTIGLGTVVMSETTSTINLTDTLNVYGNLTHKDATSGLTINGEIRVNANTVTVQSNGFITADTKGYIGAVTSGTDAEGVGGGGGSTSYGGEGGGYGGHGGHGQSAVQDEGITSGAGAIVTSMGFGGGDGGNGNGGDGGGYIQINATNILINGEISADGETGFVSSDSGGGGSGGGIWIITNDLSGYGTITVNGGDGQITGSDSGGGGGGRIFVEATIDSSSINYEAYGGDGHLGNDGGAGTILVKADGQSYGNLIITNSDRTSREITTLDGETFDNVTVSSNSDIQTSNSIVITDTLQIDNDILDYEVLDGNLTVDILILNDSFIDGGKTTITDDFIIYTEGIYTQNSLNEITITDTLQIYGNYTHSDATTFEVINGKVLVHAADIIIESTGYIATDERGYLGGFGTDGTSGQGPGGGDGSTSYGGEGGGYGGYGGDGQSMTGSESIPYGTPNDVTDLGSGGGDGDGSDGGDGGGYIRLNVTNTLTNNGIITANGQLGKVGGSDGGGGGSGGGIWIITNTLEGSGTIQSNGGNGNTISGSDGGGGGGGRIFVDVETDSSTINYLAHGGTGTSGKDGGSGTILVRRGSDLYGDLIIMNNEYTKPEYTPLDDNVAFDSITIGKDSDVQISNSFNVTGTMNVSASNNLRDVEIESSAELYLGNLTIESGVILTSETTNIINLTDTLRVYGNLTHESATQGETINGKLIINAQNVTVESGGFIHADTRGYIGGYGSDGTDGEGPCGGSGSVSYGGEGGGYGGWGGDGKANTANEGTICGKANLVIDLGNGGGDGDGGDGGDGGGYIQINATTIHVDGEISADGETGFLSADGGGGGSGGGIWLTITNTLTGTGSITSIGGKGYDAGYDGGGGAGGRIYIDVGTHSSSITFNAQGGTSTNTAQAGGAGTILIKESGDTYGDLTIDNNNVYTNVAETEFQSNQNFDNILIEDDAKVWFDANITITNHLNISSTADLSNHEIESGVVITTKDLTLGSGSVISFESTSISIDASGVVKVYGTLTHPKATSGEHNNGNIMIDTDDFILESGGDIDVANRGYIGGISDGADGEGTGGGDGDINYGGEGGGYGGEGGDGQNGGAGEGVTYEDSTTVTMMGSGGGDGDGGDGGDGGGYLRINATGIVNITGTINASGENGQPSSDSGGGGSGGGIWITSDTFICSTLIMAKGGDGATTGYDGGGGGGGRIYIEYNTEDINCEINVSGGEGTLASDGGDGTIVLQSLSSTCSCAGLNNNWEIDHADACEITEDCDIGTGKISFMGIGTTICNATISTTNMGDPGSNGIFQIDNNCIVYVN